MSYASAYAKKPPNVKGIGMTVGVHALVIVGVMALPTITVVTKERGDLKVIDIFTPKEKPPPEPAVKPQKPAVELPREKLPTTSVPPIVDLPGHQYDPAPNYADGDRFVAGGGVDEAGNFPIDDLEPIAIVADPVVIAAKLNQRFSASFQPRYPGGLLRMEEEGAVTVRVLVGINGRAKQINLISTPQPEFWEATRKHGLRKWRFKPATEDGKPVESWIRLTVKFEINS